MNLLKKEKTQNGFTLVELLVVLALIAILSTIFINSDYSRVRVRNDLLSDSEDITTSLRDMQNRTSTYMESPVVGTIGYGIYLDSTDLSTYSKISTFYKTENNMSSDISSAITPDVTTVLSNGDYISRICVYDNGATCDSIKKLSIYFLKPKSYSYFFNNDTSNLINSDKACIEISSSNGQEFRHVNIYYIGQISMGYNKCN